MWQRGLFAITDLMPQNLGEAYSRAEFDEMLRNERDPETIRSKKEQCATYERMMAPRMQDVVSNEQVEEYHSKHHEIDLDRYGSCPRCEHYKVTGKESPVSKVQQAQKAAQNFTHSYDSIFSESIPTEPQIADLPQPTFNDSSGLNSQHDDKLQLLGDLLMHANRWEIAFLRAEQEARDKLSSQAYVEVCQAAAQVHDIFISILLQAEAVQNSLPPPYSSNIFEEWLRSFGFSDRPRSHYARLSYRPVTGSHTATASTSEYVGASRQKLDVNSSTWARNSDPLPTSTKDPTCTTIDFVTTTDDLSSMNDNGEVTNDGSRGDDPMDLDVSAVPIIERDGAPDSDEASERDGSEGQDDTDLSIFKAQDDADSCNVVNKGGTKVDQDERSDEDDDEDNAETIV